MKKETYIWNDVLEQIGKRLSKPSFDTWLKPTKLKIDGDTWYIILPNVFARDWIEENYQSLIKDTIYERTNEQPEVTLIVEEKSMWASPSDDKINHGDSNVRNDKAIESDRVDQLEKEVELVKAKLGEVMDKLERYPS